MMEKNRKGLGVVLWILSFVLMIVIAIYQRTTGPTYPDEGSVEVASQEVDYKLLRSWGKETDAPVEVETSKSDLDVYLRYKRYKSHDEWTEVKMPYVDGKYVSGLPLQPPAGKMMYNVTIVDGKDKVVLSDEDVVLRFKGHVPGFILIPHIIFMFLAMVFSMRTGFEAIWIRRRTFKYASWTLLALILGGLIFGPIVQKYAFGAYWTGWPFGHDLTDNKTIVAFIFWAIAWFKLKKNPNNRFWPILAAVVFLFVYLIPHSVLGSEIDHTKKLK